MGSVAVPKFWNVVNGEKRDGETAHQCLDPRTEEPLWDAPIASVKDLDEAVAAAQKAYKTWGKSTVDERKALLVKIAETYQANQEELFDIVMKETGKSVRHSSSRRRSIDREFQRGVEKLTGPVRDSWPRSKSETQVTRRSTTVQ